MSLTRIALKFAAPLPDLEAFDRYLFVGPHPDDIEIGAGATVSRLTSLGKQVTLPIQSLDQIDIVYYTEFHR
ncbi:MAG: PIG-L deacetylase family protein, partial [Faecousia sp.]